MHVVATAGHVDHGKSTLLRAMTGMEPDRWAEEKRRGLTIDLGFAWTTLPSGRDVAFVDVPGHERFLGNMLAGLGPTPVVLFVVAADEGWQAQSGDHRDAVAALGIEHGVIVLSRADRAAAGADVIADVLADVRRELASTGLADAPAVTVSAVDGTGMAELAAVLDEVLCALPDPTRDGPVRVWVDRSFSITGAGTVVTGTLSSGTLRVGDHLSVVGRDGARPVTVRGLQSEGRPAEQLEPASRSAVNLRGVGAAEVERGDALVTPDAWWTTTVVDVRRVGGTGFEDVPEHVTAHLGSAALSARVRPFGQDHARLTLDRAVPVSVADRLVLRQPGERILGGALVLDVDPPALRRRGDAARRGEELAALTPATQVAVEVARRGAVELGLLRRMGIPGGVPDGVLVEGGWLVDPGALAAWARHLADLVADVHRTQPLSPGLNRSAAGDLLGLPTDAVLDLVARTAGLVSEGGYLRSPDHGGLGAAEAAVARLEQRLAEQPFLAPGADDLTAAGLGARELGAAERAGRLLRFGDGVVLLPDAPARAMRVLAGLDQPFTTSDARQALGTTRRVVIPLLEHLDRRGWTRRLDGVLRQVVR
ncbi:MAG TPA: SelB C-terminal domain-containing protein [Nocardioides sp.]|nr:SelB C-terminal domain-containing protein [Nocardioides sp.]